MRVSVSKFLREALPRIYVRRCSRDQIGARPSRATCAYTDLHEERTCIYSLAVCLVWMITTSGRPLAV